MSSEVEIYRRMIDREPGFKGGRHVEHDPRSRNYPWENVQGASLVTKAWPVHIDVLDQLNLGDCTGNAATYHVGADPLFAVLPSNHAALDEPFAIDLYSLATQLDSFPGSYPPDDTGSSGLGVAKAAKQRGLISGYQHTFALNDTLAAVSLNGPGIVGINWYSSMDTPNAQGLVKIARQAYVRGGHEVILCGIDVENRVVKARNSWGPSWGVNGGYFYIGWDDLGRLLGEEGDFTIFQPLATQPQPAPTPTPIPTPTPPQPKPADAADAALLAAMAQWKAAKGYS